MTRSNPVRPDDLPPPDLASVRGSLLSGEPTTTWRCGVTVDPTTVAIYGINGRETRTGGAGWLHATCRLSGTDLLMLLGHGRGTEPTWANVATFKGKQVTWRGLATDVNLVQGMRARLLLCLLRTLGFKVMDAVYDDGKLLPTDRVMVGATCQADGCHRLLTTPESILSGYGPTCGGRVKAPRTWANVSIADMMAARGKVPGQVK